MDTPQRERMIMFTRVIGIFLVSYLALSALFLVSTPRITKWLVPVFSKVASHAYPENRLLSIQSSGGSISYTMEIHKRLKGVNIPLIDTLHDSVHASFQFVTVIIYYSLLLAWPTLSREKKLKAFLISFPILLLFVCIDIPVTMISSIELACIKKLHGIAMVDTVPRKILLYTSHFINNGGRQFFAIMLFIITITPFRFRGPSEKTAGNAPESSGSRKNRKDRRGK